MKKCDIKEWLDRDKVAALLTEEEIEGIKSSYRFVFEDARDSHGKDPSIEFRTGLPLAESYYEDLILYGEGFTDDVDSAEEYVLRYAEAILKLQILCACQLVFKFPLWQDKDLLSWKEVVKGGLKELEKEALQTEEQFPFPKFFPCFSTEIDYHPKFMLDWIHQVVDEFFEMAEDNMYHLTAEEREREQEEKKRQLRVIEDFLTGKSKEIKF